MSAGSKLSSGGLASLAALLIAVAVIAAVLLGRSCGAQNPQTVTSEVCDSITAVIQAERSHRSDSTTSKKYRKKKNTVRKEPRKPRERNYLDEPANE